jgi:RNA polymerase sigma-70 factor (ECF subfamily)
MLSQHAPLATRFLSYLPSAPPGQATLPLSEAQLLAAARQGDAEAYGCLVRTYQGRLLSSLQHICGSAADAQDAAQEAFLRAYLKLDRFTGASAFYTWLFRIALNVVASARRRRQLASLDEVGEPCDRAERSEERVLRQERGGQVQAALHALSAEHRTILVLREVDDHNYDEIASVLRIPVGTVRSRLHRARLELRERLNCIQAQ